jgi:glycosyltransferase involved in cell wall biosynthesis
MIRRLVIYDHKFTQLGGHCFDYARLVAADARAAGLSVHVVAAASLEPGLEPLLGATIERRLGAPTSVGQTLPHRLASLFRRGWYRLTRRFASPDRTRDEVLLISAHHFVAEFLQWRTSARPGPGDRLYFPTLTWADCAVLCEALAARRSEAASVGDILIMLRFPPPASPATRQRLGAAMTRVSDRVTFVSDTEDLAMQYTVDTGLTVSAVRIPVDLEPLQRQAGLRPPPHPPRVVFLGEARIEKGFNQLPGAIRGLQDQDIQFTVQVLPNMSSGEPGIRASIDALTGMECGRVRLIRGELAPDAFISTLAQSHLILLPYRPGDYGLRSSGLLAQALAAGLVIIAPAAPSWLSRTVQACGGKLYDCGDQDPMALMAAIRQAADDLAAGRISMTPTPPDCVISWPTPWAAR